MIDDSDFIFAQSLRGKKCFCWCHTNTLGTILRRFPHDRKRKSMNNMCSSPFLGAKFANGKHNSEFTIQTRGNEFAPISGTFFIAFWKCRPRAQHLPLIEDPHEIFNKNKSMRNFPSELGNQFLQNVWQLKILSKKIRGMLLIVLKDKVKSIERISTFLL